MNAKKTNLIQRLKQRWPACATKLRETERKTVSGNCFVSFVLVISHAKRVGRGFHYQQRHGWATRRVLGVWPAARSGGGSLSTIYAARKSTRRPPGKDDRRPRDRSLTRRMTDHPTSLMDRIRTIEAASGPALNLPSAIVYVGIALRWKAFRVLPSIVLSVCLLCLAVYWRIWHIVLRNGIPCV